MAKKSGNLVIGLLLAGCVSAAAGVGGQPAFFTSCTKTRSTCAAHLAAGCLMTGAYRINPTGASPFNAYCDMATDGGGWTLVGVGTSANTSAWMNGNNAVGTVSNPSQGSGAVLAFSVWNAIGTVTRFKYGASKFFVKYGALAMTLSGWSATYATEPAPSCSSDNVNWSGGRTYHISDCYNMGGYTAWYWNGPGDGGAGGGTSYFMNNTGATVWVR